MTLYVVPELSLRWIGVIARSGRLAPGLSALIAASFHFLMSPLKISDEHLAREPDAAC